MKSSFDWLLQDWEANKDTSLKSRLILLLFRSAQLSARLPIFLNLIGKIYRGIYQLIVEWILGIELPWDTQVGRDLKLQHGRGLVVNHGTIIGDCCIIRHLTTIGNKKLADGSYSNCPIIGNDVDIGANATIIGGLTIGDGAVIGAAAVVVKDVPPYTIVAGNPARAIGQVRKEQLIVSKTT
jgi:putative colanic acid biosynthesis acetyltransferase WcaB